MVKILKNTTASDIELINFGITLNAGSNYTVNPVEYLSLSKNEVISEILPFLTTGDIVVNDGINDLNLQEGQDFLSYPDVATNIRFLSEPEKPNGFNSKTVQDAIEEARENSIKNFSFHKIVEDSTIDILENQHMICTSLEVDGFLNLDGGLVFL